MTYDDNDNYKAAYAYGLERFEVQALDSTRPESHDPLYYLHDGLGSVTQLTRPNGEVRDHYRYDEYGVPAPGAKLSEDGRNVNHNSFGYTGELWDEEDDLLYLRSRYYRPEMGRFVTRDVFSGFMATPSSFNKYSYVGNNPVGFVDPTGLWGATTHYNITTEIAQKDEININEADTAIIRSYNFGTDLNYHGETTGVLGLAGTSWHENIRINGKIDDFNYEINIKKVCANDWTAATVSTDLSKVYGRIYKTKFLISNYYKDIQVENVGYDIKLNAKDFSLYNANDTRYILAEQQLRYAKNLMHYASDANLETDSVDYQAIKKEALIHIGMGLHAIQDVTAHQGPEKYPESHNKNKGKYPDDIEYDYDPKTNTYHYHKGGGTRLQQLKNDTTSYLKMATEIT